MQHLFLFLCFILCFSQSPLFAHPVEAEELLSIEDIYQQFDIVPSGEKGYITLGNDSFHAQQQSLSSMGLVESVRPSRIATIVEVDKAALPAIGEVNHLKFKRCGGYFYHNSLKEAQEHVAKMERMESLSRLPSNSSLQRSGFQNSRMSWGNLGGGKPGDTTRSTIDYSINQQNVVKNLIAQVEESNIRNSILKLSSFKNRYYQSPSGVEAAEWIAAKAKDITKHRSDVSIELFKHSKWSQPSVIVTVKGKSAETIVIGGHLDSINGYFGGDNMAPGADDNASGISTWLEVLRVLLANNYQPQKTIQFMGYAAEEVGLRGSNEIAKKYNTSKVPVIGVVQLDMTNFKGAEKLIYLMTDYTNEAQNTFVGSLIDEYVKVPWGYDQCGYGCSDHASWHGQGYPASMPFEATMKGMNKNIHTANDKIEISNNNASHAVNFAKLALAFAVELDR